MLPLNPTQIPVIFKQAQSLQAKGDLVGAEVLYRQILAINKNLAEVHFHLGRLQSARKEWALAKASLEVARRIKPHEGIIWQALANLISQNGDPVAKKEFKAAILTAPLSAPVKAALQKIIDPTAAQAPPNIGGASPKDFNAAVAALAANENGKAEKIAKNLAKKYPDASGILDVFAVAQGKLGKTQEARETFDKALAIDAQNPTIQRNYARFLMDSGTPEDAMPMLRRLYAANPKDAVALRDLGKGFGEIGELEKAFDLLERALVQNPKDAQTYKTFIPYLIKATRFSRAIDLCQILITLEGKNLATYTLMAEALVSSDRTDEAEVFVSKALARFPQSSAILYNWFNLCVNQGKFDAAEKAFKKLIKVKPERGEIYRIYSSFKKLPADDPVVAQIEKNFAKSGGDGFARAQFGFALSKLAEDNRDYAKAFVHLKAANDLVRGKNGYDLADTAKEHAEMRRLFEGFDYTPVAKETADGPIFVVGLPRSGTTLIERIFTSHSRVTGASENGHFMRVAHHVLDTSQREPVARLADIPDAIFDKIGTAFMDRLHEDFPKNQTLADKSLPNFRYLGLIKKALPNARVVVVRRDPRDNLLSIYKNVFPEGTHPYAYDLVDLAGYYKLFDRMIDFWTAELGDWFYQVNYEDITSDPENQIRRLVDFAGLDWEEDCLNFHQNKAAVKTLSVYQARQPIYKSSVKSWQNFEAELAPMFAALEGE